VGVELTRADHERLADVCRRFGVSRLDVFGSVSRGDDRDESDVDLLYELAPDAKLGWGIEDLAVELERLLGRPVDLVSKRALHPALRDAVLGEARPLYAA
jgi:predicted nucleotidyltransferase